MTKYTKGYLIIMSYALATITIKDTEEPALLTVLKELEVGCKLCKPSISNKHHSTTTATYTIDVSSECLERIKQTIKFVSMTVTNYNTTVPLGLKVIDIS